MHSASTQMTRMCLFIRGETKKSESEEKKRVMKRAGEGSTYIIVRPGGHFNEGNCNLVTWRQVRM